MKLTICTSLVTLLLLCMCLVIGCATAGTHASISQTSPDGYTEVVEFETNGVVTWGSKQDLQKGDLLYTWGDEGGTFGAGGEAVGQVSADPMTELTVRLLERAIERAFPVPVARPPGTELLTPENIQLFMEWINSRGDE